MGISAYLGKGLREPCSSHREAYYFGAELNAVDADGWNCLPQIVEPTTRYDLSAITENHEVVVALVNASNVSGKDFSVSFRWYRSRDGSQLYSYTYRKGNPEWEWCYAYSYIGYHSREIFENGEYTVEIRVTGDISFSRTLTFTISGITEVVEPEPPSPVIQTGIVDAFNNVSAWFYSIYVDVLGVPVIGEYLAIPFYWLSSLFSSMAWGFSDFFTWINEISPIIAAILDWDTIWGLIQRYIPNWNKIGNWFSDWGSYVLSLINTWWSEKLATVKGWISIATEGLNSLKVAWNDFWKVTFPQWTSSLEKLRADWDYFIKFTLPALTGIEAIEGWWQSRLEDIQDLINSAIANIMPMIEGWQDFKNSAVEFFSDPWSWLYNRFDDFFERFW